MGGGGSNTFTLTLSPSPPPTSKLIRGYIFKDAFFHPRCFFYRLCIFSRKKDRVKKNLKTNVKVTIILLLGYHVFRLTVYSTLLHHCSAQTQTRMGCLRKSPEVEFDWLSHLGISAPYAAWRKRRYEANQVWMNTTLFSQGPQSWGKLAVETWRLKTELIIITILHIIIITTSILNLGFKTIA